MKKNELLVKYLIENNKTISTMESCTGGLLASTLTDVSGSSEVLKFSAVTYSNLFKIKMGVSKNIIDKYSVYSIETAHEMSESICKFTSSTYGVGITGKINREDSANERGNNDEVFISIYDKVNNKHYDEKIICPLKERNKVKKYIVNKVLNKFLKEVRS